MEVLVFAYDGVRIFVMEVPVLSNGGADLCQ